MARKTPTLLNDYHLLAFDELDSTNDEARRIALKGGGTGHGAVVWAKRQTAGRGRMERKWESREGNLFVSVLLAPDCDIAEASQLSFVAAVAARDAICPVLPEDANLQFKWPNDLLIGGRKAAGILLETFVPPSDPQKRLWAIVGCGLNIESHPKETLFPATCLKSEGVELISAKIVLSRFIHHFVERYNQWSRSGGAIMIRREWLKHAWRIGEQVCVALPGEELIGKFEGIETSGSLVLKCEGGGRQVIPAGDLSLRMAEEKVS